MFDLEHKYRYFESLAMNEYYDDVNGGDGNGSGRGGFRFCIGEPNNYNGFGDGSGFGDGNGSGVRFK